MLCFYTAKNCQRLSYFLFSSFGHNIKFLKDAFFLLLSSPTPCLTSLSIAFLTDDIVSNMWSFSSRHATCKDFSAAPFSFLF